MHIVCPPPAKNLNHSRPKRNRRQRLCQILGCKQDTLWFWMNIFNSFISMHKISTWVVCVNGKHLSVSKDCLLSMQYNRRADQT